MHVFEIIRSPFAVWLQVVDKVLKKTEFVNKWLGWGVWISVWSCQMRCLRPTCGFLKATSMVFKHVFNILAYFLAGVIESVYRTFAQLLRIGRYCLWDESPPATSIGLNGTARIRKANLTNTAWMIFARRRALVHTVPVASSRAADLWRDVWEAAKPLMVGLMNQMSWYPDEIESVQTALLQQGAWKKGLEPGYTIVVGQDHGLSHVITFLVFYVFLRLFVLNFRNLECPNFHSYPYFCNAMKMNPPWNFH